MAPYDPDSIKDYITDCDVHILFLCQRFLNVENVVTFFTFLGVSHTLRSQGLGIGSL